MYEAVVKYDIEHFVAIKYMVTMSENTSSRLTLGNIHVQHIR